MDEKVLSCYRHSLAHVMAKAVIELYGPETQYAIGPQIDDGFYYDFLLPEGKTVTEADFKTIEDKTGKWFTGAGLYRLDNNLVPKLNVVYQKNRIMVGASVGLYNNQPIYGVDINFKVK